MAKRVLDQEWGMMYDADDRWETTAPAGSYPEGASPFGVLDMSGNVWEWTEDRYGPYPARPEQDPRGPATGSERVTRGGGWEFHDAGFVRATVRDKNVPSHRLNNVGFRCVYGVRPSWGPSKGA